LREIIKKALEEMVKEYLSETRADITHDFEFEEYLCIKLYVMDSHREINSIEQKNF
jgi:ribosomal protein S17E